MSIEQFKTRERANTASRVPLLDPATGKATEHWIEVRSSLSDVFREARDRAMQETAELSTVQDEAQRVMGVKASKLRMTASLLAGWSFDIPFTPDAAAGFLRDAPQVADAVIAIADNRHRFFASSSDTSKPGPEPK